MDEDNCSESIDGKVRCENRVRKAIAKYNEVIPTKPKEAIAGIEKSVNDTSDTDLFQYQSTQSQAFASGKITKDEAMDLYRIFGGEVPTHEKWVKQPLADKIVATQIVGELMAAKLKQRGVYPR